MFVLMKKLINPPHKIKSMCLAVPRRLVEKLEKRGIDVESTLVDLLAKTLDLDAEVAVEAHLELALKYLEEGRNLVERDPVQASRKLYRAAEETVKALTMHFNLSDILAKVEKRGRWTVTELEKAVEAISERLGEWFSAAWDRACALHVWGFHEAKLDSEAIRIRIPYVERIVVEAREAVKRK
jgi:hypothetical protein